MKKRKAFHQVKIKMRGKMFKTVTKIKQTSSMI